MRRFLCIAVLASLVAPAVAQQPREGTAQARSQPSPASQPADEKSVELTIENQTGGSWNGHRRQAARGKSLLL